MFENFKDYKDSVERFSAYVKRLEQAFILHNVKKDKNVSGIISCMGPKFYNFLINFKSPESPKYDVIVDLLLKYIIQAQNKISECIKFQKCFEYETKSVQDFSARLRKFRLIALSLVTH